MSAPFYSYDPCVTSGNLCGATFPCSTLPCTTSCSNWSACSVCPGGGCSSCPAPVRPCPEPAPALPILPCLPPCPPCVKPRICPPPAEKMCKSIAIPYCRPNRCKPRPNYCCMTPKCCKPTRCSHPGVPICNGCLGPCMPIW